jgi:hypothetical protein
MRVAISGSRGFTDGPLVERVVQRLLAAGHTINVGDAKSGVDYLVLMYHETAPWADEYGSDTLKVYEARWDIEGKRAGNNRNKWMVSESDMLVAMFAPELPLSPGTFNAVTHARAKGIPVHVYFEPLGWAVLLKGPQ